MILKKFQTKAVTKLLNHSLELINEEANKKIIFKSPTGSGKTIVIAEFINRFVSSKVNNSSYSFIWTTPRKTLTEQSKKKLNKYFKNIKKIKCSFFDELNENYIQENEIVFVNWESINKENKNTIIRENEKEFYLSKVLEKTRDKGHKLILLIDESHHHATSEISTKLIKDISPDLTIEVSATPVMKDPDAIVPVSLEEVKLEGMIKKSVRLCENFKNLLSGTKIKTSLANGSEKFVIDQAIKKQNELLKNFKSLKSKVRPLILIQLPDKKTKYEDRLKNEIIKYLKDKYKITTQNGKLAIYLSENKKNLENISKNENEVDVMIFKQAIALGWDCPRAQILVLFRDWKNITFSIQTVGRVMRMPEVEKGHYKKDTLNHSYVYTNLENIELKEDQAKDYLTIFTSKSRKKIKLKSYSRVRQREKTRLNPLFIKIFLNEANVYKLKSKIKLKNQKANFSWIKDETALSTDSLIKKKFKGKNIEITNEDDLQRVFDYFIYQSLPPFFPEDRSVGRIKEAIYKFFKTSLNIDYDNSFKEIINICLSKDNRRHFEELINISKSEYSIQSNKKEDEFKIDPEWNFPEVISFTGKFSEIKTKKSVMKPFYYDYKWKTEENFIKILDRSSKVDFWFKNGDRDQTYFSLPYKEGKQINLFYVDFIVKFKNGKIGLFDTKSGRTIDTAKNKSDGLQDYIKENKKYKIFGGIVTNKDNKNFSGKWILFNKKGNLINSKKFDNWEDIKF